VPVGAGSAVPEWDVAGQLLRALPDAVFALDAELRFSFVNVRAAGLLGQSEAGLLGRVWSEVRPEMAGEEVLSAVPHVLQVAQAVTVQGRSGELELEWRVFPLGSGVGVQVRDMSDVASVRRELGRARQIIDESADCIKVMDLDAHLLSMNAGGMRVMEIDDFASCRNLLWSGFWTGETQERVRDALDRARAGERSVFTGETPTWKGSPRHWEVQVAPVRDASGTVVELMALSRDVTARVRAERTLKGMTGLLEQRVEERTHALKDAKRFAEALAALGDALQQATTTEDLALRALPMLGEALGASSAMVVQVRGGRLRIPTIWGEVTPSMRAVQSQGKLLSESPLLSASARSGEAGYYEDYQESGGSYQDLPPSACAVEPVRTPDGTLRGFLAVWRRRGGVGWQGSERDLLRRAAATVGLVMERTSQGARLAEQNAMLEAQARALDGFSDLTRDFALQRDPRALIRQALELVQRMLPRSVCLYYEPRGAQWQLVTQVGRADLPGAADRDLQVGEAGALDQVWASGDPVFESRPDGTVEGGTLGASAALPLCVSGAVQGVLSVGLFGQRRWTMVDRAVLETVTRSLGTAIEGSVAVRDLHRTQHYLKVAADNAPLLLFVTDRDGVFTLSEGSLLSRLGLQPGEAVGQSAMRMFAHEPDLRGGSRLKRALQGEVVHALTRFQQSGAVFQTWFVPVRDAQGDVNEVVGISLDVTDAWTRNGRWSRRTATWRTATPSCASRTRNWRPSRTLRRTICVRRSGT